MDLGAVARAVQEPRRRGASAAEVCGPVAAALRAGERAAARRGHLDFVGYLLVRSDHLFRVWNANLQSHQT